MKYARRRRLGGKKNYSRRSKPCKGVPPEAASDSLIGRNAVKIPDDETSRMLDEECPGSPDLESVLANESVGSAASHPALVVDASAPLAEVLQQMREENRGAALVVSNAMRAGIITE